MSTGASTDPAEPTMANRIVRVLIADDHFSTRMGLAALMGRQKDFEVVAEAENGRQAIDQAIALEVDLAILDLRMPEINGIEAAAKIRHRRPQTRLIILTTFDDVDDVQAALAGGVDAYLLKGTPREEFLEAVEAVLAGQTYIPPAIKKKLRQFAERPKLTARELETLRMLTLGRNNRDIAKALFVSDETVKSHLKSVFRKLDVNDRVGAVVEALRLGLVRLESDNDV